MLSTDKTITSWIASSSPGRRVTARAAGVVAFTALTVVGAKVAVPLPGTAVPFTLQVLAVLLAGFVLGPRLGAASQLLYLAAGLAGLPVFAAGGGAGYLLGPTGGYLLAYPAAAALAGWAGRKSVRLPGMIAGAVAAVALIHAGGAAWLAVVAGGDVALRTGVLPFLPGDLLKIALAVLIGSRLSGRSRRVDD